MRENFFILTFRIILFDLIKKKWVKRRNFSKAIARVASVSPKDVKRFYFKLILHRIKRDTCFDHLKTYL